MKSSEVRIDDRGFALLSVIAVVGALLVAGIAAVRMTRTELRGTADSVAERRAFYVAEGGVQRALARLSQDRATAATSTAYTFTESTQALGDGTYSVTVVQDPLFPTDATRKRITSVGVVDRQQSTVVNHAVVQNPLPSTVCFTDLGTCRIQSAVAAVTELFDGEIFSNNDVAIETSVGLAVRGTGNIYAKDRFYDQGLTVAGVNALPAVLSEMNANLYSGVQYTPTGTLSIGSQQTYQTLFGNLIGNLLWGVLGAAQDPHVGPLFGVHLYGLGLHFQNGPSKHGVTQVIPQRPFPRVDWKALRRDPRTEVVNAENVPFGSWDAASGTWHVGALFSPPVDADVIYYVQGNAHVESLQLRKGVRMTIAARGWIAAEAISVLNVGLLPGSTQSVRLIALRDNSIGRRLLSYQPLALEGPLNAISPTLGMATGIGLNVLGALTTRNRVFAYSETRDVWAKVSTLTAASTNNRIGLVAKNDATLAYTGSILSSMKPY
jgi:hypothetical protein